MIEGTRRRGWEQSAESVLNKKKREAFGALLEVLENFRIEFGTGETYSGMTSRGERLTIEGPKAPDEIVP